MQITVNETGARTLKDTRPMQIDGQNVYVTVGGGTASLFIGGRIVAERKADDMSTKAAQDWAVQVRDERVADLDAAWGEWIEANHVDPVELLDEQTADEDAVAEATDPAAVYAGAVESVRAQAVELLAKAEAAEAHGDAPYRFRNSGGRMVTFTSSDPRHPSRAAASYRRDAERLAAWTWQDEQAYGRYVDDGISATDGYFAPIVRAAWKATLGA